MMTLYKDTRDLTKKSKDVTKSAVTGMHGGSSNDVSEKNLSHGLIGETSESGSFGVMVSGCMESDHGDLETNMADECHSVDSDRLSPIGDADSVSLLSNSDSVSHDDDDLLSHTADGCLISQTEDGDMMSHIADSDLDTMDRESDSVSHITEPVPLSLTEDGGLIEHMAVSGTDVVSESLCESQEETESPMLVDVIVPQESPRESPQEVSTPNPLMSPLVVDVSQNANAGTETSSVASSTSDGGHHLQIPSSRTSTFTPTASTSIRTSTPSNYLSPRQPQISGYCVSRNPIRHVQPTQSARMVTGPAFRIQAPGMTVPMPATAANRHRYIGPAFRMLTQPRMATAGNSSQSTCTQNIRSVPGGVQFGVSVSQNAMQGNMASSHRVTTMGQVMQGGAQQIQRVEEVRRIGPTLVRRNVHSAAGLTGTSVRMGQVGVNPYSLLKRSIWLQQLRNARGGR